MRVRASKLCKDRSDITQREKRTKTGCLTCRKRRKKCTEEKPRCFKCVANNLECKWPDTIILNNKLSVLKYKEKTSRIAKAINTKKAPDELKDYSTNSESKTSVDENLLFHLCVDLFLPNLLTQDLNSLCEEGNSYIVQQTQKNPVLKEAFLCCGATYLEIINPKKYAELSQSLYESTSALFDNYFNKAITDIQKYETLLPPAIVLCVRESIAAKANTKRKNQWLSYIYKLIDKRYDLSLSPASYSAEEDAELNRYESSAAIKIGSEILLESSSNAIIKPFEKLLLESFMYNFSVTIPFTTNVMDIPDPFTLFEEMNKVLQTSVYNRDYEWDKNPLFGASMGAFEMLSKACYLSRLAMHLDNKSVFQERFCQLERTSKFYTPSFPTVVLRKQPQDILDAVKRSVAVSKLVWRVSLLLIGAIKHYQNWELHSENVTSSILEIITIIESLPKVSRYWVLLPCPLFLSGFFTLETSHREKILGGLHNLPPTFNQNSILSMQKILEETWALPEKLRLNMLFDLAKLWDTLR